LTSCANREAQEAKKREAEVLAKLQAIEDKEKTDLELAQSALEKAQKDLADRDAALLTASRKTAARDAGVDPQYADYAAGEYAKADPETTAEDFFKEFKTAHPAMFGGNGEAPGSGGGGPTAATASSGAMRLEAVKNELAQLMAGPRGGDLVEKKIWKLGEEAAALMKELKT
jgi:membrane protein involved in colicin uptake